MRRLLPVLLLTCLCGFPLHAQKGAIITRNAAKIARALYYIETRYVDTVDMDKAIDKMLESLVEQLDPHSAYIPKDRVEETNEPLEGSFEGIGIEFAIVADTLTVQAVTVGGPSEAVGLRPGDKIVAIDGENVAGVGLTNNGVRDRLRGPKGSQVVVTVRRGDLQQDFVIRRDTIPLTSIDAVYMTDSDVLYVKLSRFAQNTATELVKAMTDVPPRLPRGIVIDLRGNGGGFMQVAVILADIFLEKGQTIVRTEGNDIDREERATGMGFYQKGPVVVLVDEYSASASEIVAGALQDWDRAVIVGRRTFGKGLVQQQYPLPDGAEMRLTVARYHTPSGRVVQSPYEKGNRDAYFRQVRERYERGESFSLDSIALPDSLRFRTLKLGRPVYGGGGIIPDVFVPYDTTGMNRFLVKVIGSGALQDYAYDYLDRHREELAAKDIASFEKVYASFAGEAFDGLLAYSSGKGIEPESDEELAACTPILKTRLKALVARGILGTNGYWQVINREEDPEFQRALEIVENWKDAFPIAP